MESISYNLSYYGSVYRFPLYNVFVVDKIAGQNQRFADLGDSGSGVFVVEDGKPDQALGIEFALAKFSQETFVCKIANILNFLGLEIVRYRENNKEQTLPSTEKM